MGYTSQEMTARIDDVLSSAMPGTPESEWAGTEEEGNRADADARRLDRGDDALTQSTDPDEWRPFAEWAWGELAPEGADPDLPDWFDEFTTVRVLADKTGRDIDDVRATLRRGPARPGVCGCWRCAFEAAAGELEARTYGGGILRQVTERLERRLAVPLRVPDAYLAAALQASSAEVAEAMAAALASVVGRMPDDQAPHGAAASRVIIDEFVDYSEARVLDGMALPPNTTIRLITASDDDE